MKAPAWIRRLIRARQWKHGVVLDPSGQTRDVVYVFNCADPAGVVVSSPRFPHNEPPELWTVLDLLADAEVGTVVVGTYPSLRGRLWFAETRAPTLTDRIPVGVGNRSDAVAALVALLAFVRKTRLTTGRQKP